MGSILLGAVMVLFLDQCILGSFFCGGWVDAIVPGLPCLFRFPDKIATAYVGVTFSLRGRDGGVASVQCQCPINDPATHGVGTLGGGTLGGHPGDAVWLAARNNDRHGVVLVILRRSDWILLLPRVAGGVLAGQSPWGYSRCGSPANLRINIREAMGTKTQSVLVRLGNNHGSALHINWATHRCIIRV